MCVMKVLIYGSEGWIGKQVCRELDNMEIEYFKGNERAEDTYDLENEINQIKPTHVMSFIGRTHGKIDNTYYSTIDYLEQPGKIKENVRDNLFAPISLALICKC